MGFSGVMVAVLIAMNSHLLHTGIGFAVFGAIAGAFLILTGSSRLRPSRQDFFGPPRKAAQAVSRNASVKAARFYRPIALCLVGVGVIIMCVAVVS